MKKITHRFFTPRAFGALGGVAALTLFAACAGKPLAKPTGLTPKDFWAEQAERARELSSVTAKMLLEYQGLKESVSGQSRVLAQWPNQFRLELRDPLGRVQFLISLLDKNFVAYYPTLKKAYLDDTFGKAYLRGLLGTDLSFGDLEGVSLGLLPKNLASEIKTWEWDSARGMYAGQISLRDKAVTLYVDAERATLRELWVKSSVGLTKIVYSEFALCCGGLGKSGHSRSVNLAHYVALTNDQLKTSVDIEWKQMEKLDKPKGESVFHVELPAGVEKVRLE